MDFNSVNFLFIFLPIFLVLFIISSTSIRKWVVLLASVVFYINFGKQNFLLITSLIIFNYLLTRLMAKIEEKTKYKKMVFWLGITCNLLLLTFIKLVSRPEIEFIFNIGSLEKSRSLIQKAAPIGFSFICFQFISCLIDSYHSPKLQPKKLADYASYIFFFPKVAAGPITKYSQFADQFSNLNISSPRFAEGAMRFIKGFAKKVIIADQVAVVVNAAFGLEKPAFSSSIAWFVLIAYFVQIYYDFSGYIDMGLGIAHMIGFDLPENFNSPYLSKSIAEFWRRWHMTLQTWFRDYVFYPIERARRKVKIFRTESNILFVFVLTGLWHGFTLNFLIWGILQSVLIILENSRLGKWMKRLPGIVQHVYLWAAVLFSWVIFRSPTIGYALRFFKRLIIIDQSVQLYSYSILQPLPLINNSVILAVIIGLIGIFPIQKICLKLCSSIHLPPSILVLGKGVLYLILLVISIALLTNQEFIPSIYGQF